MSSNVSWHSKIFKVFLFTSSLSESSHLSSCPGFISSFILSCCHLIFHPVLLSSRLSSCPVVISSFILSCCHLIFHQVLLSTIVFKYSSPNFFCFDIGADLNMHFEALFSHMMAKRRQHSFTGETSTSRKMPLILILEQI